MDEKQPMEANFSTLIMSLASAAAMAMGLAPDPNTQETKKDLEMAQFNIDLLILLKDKTKNNLSDDEDQFLQTVLSDLQMQFLKVKESQ